jgi:hypothetical protein
VTKGKKSKNACFNIAVGSNIYIPPNDDHSDDFELPSFQTIPRVYKSFACILAHAWRILLGSNGTDTKGKILMFYNSNVHKASSIFGSLISQPKLVGVEDLHTV